MCLIRQTSESSSSSSSSGVETDQNPPLQISHILQFSGASAPHSDSAASTSRFSANGFYGPAGAAAILFVVDNEDSDEFAAVHEFLEGLGNQTVSAAEYRGLILGLRETLRRGYRHITVQGNSELVVNQVSGSWQIGHPGLRTLCDEALQLRDRFESFSIRYIDQNRSGVVDDRAVQAISLPDGQVEVHSLIQ